MRPDEDGAVEMRPAEVGFFKMRPAEDGAARMCLEEVGASDIRSLQVHASGTRRAPADHRERACTSVAGVSLGLPAAFLSGDPCWGVVLSRTKAHSASSTG